MNLKNYIVKFLLVVISVPKVLFGWLYIIWKTLLRDIRFFILHSKVNTFSKKCVQENNTIPKAFAKHVKDHPKKLAFISESESWSFEKVEDFSNRIANYFDGEGYQAGDTIALLLENCPAYPSIWIGLSKRGIATALINTNLVKDSLLFCIKAANCKAVIFGSAYVKAINDITHKLEFTKLYKYKNDPDEEENILPEAIDLQEGLNSVSGKDHRPHEISHNDPILYIYTSGTTGLPKAAILTHVRYLVMLKMLNEAANIIPDDVFYTPLPLYHAAGGAVGVGVAFVLGSTVVIRKKFSASNYFKDCAKYNVTVAQYIGEICRYLLTVPSNNSKAHHVRSLVGNGLRPQIWKKFVDKFGLKQIIEIYGATEGIANIANFEGKIGAVGFIPRYIKWLSPITNIKCEEITGEPIRNKDGYCIECGVGEPGIMIAQINPSKIMFNYYGYTDKKQSESKILYDVFRKGDKYFNSGDILVYDEFGYYYFVDRIGDTFRWKGENVSTSEVEAIISKIIQFGDVVVYGVEVPHCEGKAGMAAIADQNRNLDTEALGNDIKLHLPSYATPLFIRIMDSLPVTGTFKLKKTSLKEEGFNIHRINENIYFLHPRHGKYVLLTKDIYEEIQRGEIRL